MHLSRVDQALDRVRAYLLSTQLSNGSWSGSVKSDPRPTAFYMNTVRHLGRGADSDTREMETYLASQQLACGAWSALPSGPPDIDVTTVCVLALRIADTEEGRRARRRAKAWLSGRAPPSPDSFWRGLLALDGDLSWSDLPYLSPRIVTNSDWVHPNIYDFSFLRIAIVSASLLQGCDPGRSVAPDTPDRQSEIDEDRPFVDWKRRWVSECRKPIRGVAPTLCSTLRAVDRRLPVDRHRRAALDWLLAHQEQDGSFFSSVHMTSIAIVTLHRLDATRFERQIEAGLDAMRRWHRIEGMTRCQQFTDSTNWDTFLSLDLLGTLGVPNDHPQMVRALDYVLSGQATEAGDWSHRTTNAKGRGWGFQRVGAWYPDNDDTVMAVTALLNIGGDAPYEAARDGVEWLLAMQSSNGGWASWDRNDRAWIRLPGGGRWFARDLDSTEITARIVTLFSRILGDKVAGFDDLRPALRRAARRGLRRLRRTRKDGRWFGRWFTHYLYGTCHALEAYRQTGHRGDHRDVRSALAWLISVANPDGGYGESPASGANGAFVPAPSTPFHTACALLAMVHAGASRHPSAGRAAAWLMERQDVSGGWVNEDFFAAGVPGLWYANFELTPTYFAAKSLWMFKEDRRDQ